MAAVKVADDRATGVQCADGTFVPRGHRRGSCADGHTTIFKMLGGKFVDNESAFFTAARLPGAVQVSLGIRKVFPARRTP